MAVGGKSDWLTVKCVVVWVLRYVSVFCVAYPLNTSPNEPFPILSSLVKSLSGSTSASKRNKEAMTAA